jgi:hypothetical protein
MPSLRHEALVTLFRNRPTLAAELLRDALHAPVPEYGQVREVDAALTEIVPTEYRADLVLVLADAAEGSQMAIVVEAQLGRDPDKAWSWPVYLATLRARLRCDVALLVVTDSAAVASWAATPIETGHPGWVLQPLAKVALAAAGGLDREKATLYSDLVVWSVDARARAMLEALMMSGKWEYQSDFVRRYVMQGRAEERAQSVLAVLAARHVDVPEVARARIAACSDLAVLEQWLARAATASSVADVLPD